MKKIWIIGCIYFNIFYAMQEAKSTIVQELTRINSSYIEQKLRVPPIDWSLKEELTGRPLSEFIKPFFDRGLAYPLVISCSPDQELPLFCDGREFWRRHFYLDTKYDKTKKGKQRFQKSMQDVFSVFFLNKDGCYTGQPLPRSLLLDNSGAILVSSTDVFIATRTLYDEIFGINAQDKNFFMIHKKKYKKPLPLCFNNLPSAIFVKLLAGRYKLDKQQLYTILSLLNKTMDVTREELMHVDKRILEKSFENIESFIFNHDVAQNMCDVQKQYLSIVPRAVLKVLKDALMNEAPFSHQFFAMHDGSIHATTLKKIRASLISFTKSDDGTSKLWNYQKGEEITTFPGQDWEFEATDTVCIVWNGDEALLCDPVTGKINDCFTPEGHTLYAVNKYGQCITKAHNHDNVLYLWDAFSHTILKTLVNDERNTEYSFDKVQFSPDGSLLMATYLDHNIVEIWDINSGQMISVLDYSGHPKFLIMDQKNRSLFVGTQDGALTKCYVGDNKCLNFHNNAHGPISALALSRDGKNLAVAYQDNKNFALFDAFSGALISAYSMPNEGYVETIYFCEDPQLLILEYNTGLIHFFDTKNEQCLLSFSNHLHENPGIALGNNRLLYVPNNSGNMHVIDLVVVMDLQRMLRGQTPFSYYQLSRLLSAFERYKDIDKEQRESGQ